MSNLIHFSENNVAGCPRLVKGQLLDLLSPIAEYHGNSFLTAFSIVWKERRSRASVLSSTVRPYYIYLKKKKKLNHYFIS